jgi:hypothetical protein
VVERCHVHDQQAFHQRLHPVANKIGAPGIEQDGFPGQGAFWGRQMPLLQRLEQGGGGFFGAGMAGFAPLVGIAAVELEGEVLRMAKTSCWWISITVSTSLLARSLMLKLRRCCCRPCAAMGGLPQAASRAAVNRQASRAGMRIHEEQLTSIFLAQSGGSAA